MFTPVGISFVDINDLGNAKNIPKRNSNMFDECANKIGQLKTSFKIKGMTKASGLVRIIQALKNVYWLTLNIHVFKRKWESDFFNVT